MLQAEAAWDAGRGEEGYQGGKCGELQEGIVYVCVCCLHLHWKYIPLKIPIYLFIFMCTCVFLHEFIHASCVQEPLETTRGHMIPWNWSCRRL